MREMRSDFDTSFWNVASFQALAGSRKGVGTTDGWLCDFRELLFPGFWIGWWLGGELDHRRQRNAGGLEHRARTAGSNGTQAKPSSGLIDISLDELIEITNDVGPLKLTASRAKPIGEFLAQ